MRHLRKFKKNILIIHGYNTNNKECFYPWLKYQLESMGYDVDLPNLPNSDNPNVNDQVKFLLKNFTKKKDIIIGHSLGGCVAMKLIEKLDYDLESLVLVSSFIDCQFDDGSEDDLKNCCDWNFDFENIKSKSDVYILKPNIDTEVTEFQTQSMADKFNKKIIYFKEVEDHACGDTEPGILKFLKNII